MVSLFEKIEMRNFEAVLDERKNGITEGFTSSEEYRNFHHLGEIYEHTFSKLNTLDANKREICECLAFKFYLPAITYTNFFFERLMKFSIFIKTPGCIYDDSESKKIFKKLDNENLSVLIHKCRELDIINDKELTKLKKLLKYRNGFGHANYEKIFQDGANPWKNLDGSESSSRGKPLENIDYYMLTRKEAPKYFMEIFKIADNIDNRLEGRELNYWNF